MLRIFLRGIAQRLQGHCAGAAQVDKAALHIGAVAFIHRIGSSLSGHVRSHTCVVDGVLEEVEVLHWTTLAQPLVADRFRPMESFPAEIPMTPDAAMRVLLKPPKHC